MSIFKRGRIYWYKFMWDGQMVRESTRQTNQNTARQIEGAHRASLARGEVGIREKKTFPTLADFISQRFEPWAEASTSAKTWLDYYRPGIRSIQIYKPLANLRLNEITSEKTADFAAWRRSAGLQVSSVNSSLQVLRRVVRLAAQWGAIEVAPLVKLLPGERHREHVVKPHEEARYLAAAPEPLGSVAAVLTDTGMRPDEPLAVGICDLDEWKKWDSSRDPRQDGYCSPGAPLNRSCQEHPAGPLEGCRKSGRGLGVVCSHTQWPFREIHAKEATQEDIENQWSATFRSLQLASHVPDATGGIGL